VKVAVDEQIFALQKHGGISRLFYEVMKQYVANPDLDVNLLPFARPIINDYVLTDPQLRSALNPVGSKTTVQGLFRQTMPGQFDSQAQVVHHTFYLPPGLFRYKNAKRIVTVYDMIPELMRNTKRRLDFATRKRKFLEAADHVICISQSTLNDVQRIWPDLQAPMSVVYLGANPAFNPNAAPDPSLPPRYVLHVGNRSDYKDAWTLTQAFTRIAGDYPDVTLLYVGGGAPTPAERKQWASLGGGDRINWLSATEEQLPSIYAQAELCVVPSRYEGFGLPTLEGLASGTPQILADTSSLPEVGGLAARYFTPGNSAQLAEHMDAVLSDPQERTRLCELGLTQAAQFSWQKTARETAAIYRESLNQT
jgi:glycosyltransferase involved in cell wall biosynthesis